MEGADPGDGGSPTKVKGMSGKALFKFLKMGLSSDPASTITSSGLKSFIPSPFSILDFGFNLYGYDSPQLAA